MLWLNMTLTKLNPLEKSSYALSEFSSAQTCFFFRSVVAVGVEKELDNHAEIGCLLAIALVKCAAELVGFV